MLLCVNSVMKMKLIEHHYFAICDNNKMIYMTVYIHIFEQNIAAN